MSTEDPTRIALTWFPGGKKKRGCQNSPVIRWPFRKEMPLTGQAGGVRRQNKNLR